MPITGDIQLLPLEGLASSGKKYGASGVSSHLEPLTASGRSYYHSSGAMTIPMMTMAMSFMQGATFNAALTLPRMTMSAGGGASANLTLPMLTMTASGTVVGWAYASIDLPMLTMDAHGITGAGWSARLTLPLLTASMRLGWRGRAVLPALTMAGSFSAMERFTGAMVLPLLAVTGNVVPYSYPWRAALTLPMLVAGPYGFAHLTLPRLTMEAVMSSVLVDFEGWVVNVRNRGITRFTNFPFTQFVTAHGKTYGVGAGGLYELGGNTDAGEPIQWEFETGLSNLGRPGLKHIPYLYLDGIIDGEVEIALIDDRNRVFAYHYNTKQRGAVHLQHRRKLGNGIRTTNVAFRLRSTSGAYIELDAIEPEVTVTQRSI